MKFVRYLLNDVIAKNVKDSTNQLFTSAPNAIAGAKKHMESAIKNLLSKDWEPQLSVGFAEVRSG